VNIVIAYTAFAIIATITNIGGQEVTIQTYSGPFAIAASMVVGTLAGLVTKYTLDKRYIFRFETNSIIHDGQTFILYTFMSVFTTIIFVVFEGGFHLIFETKHMRYLGAIIGLAFGYLVKYQLDKRFVFTTKRHRQAPIGKAQQG
jgi:putative flippase GtrA